MHFCRFLLIRIETKCKQKYNDIISKEEKWWFLGRRLCNFSFIVLLKELRRTLLLLLSIILIDFYRDCVWFTFEVWNKKTMPIMTQFYTQWSRVYKRKFRGYICMLRRNDYIETSCITRIRSERTHNPATRTGCSVKNSDSFSHHPRPVEN